MLRMGDHVILPLPPQLDKTDRRIIYELEKNSRQSLGKLAKKTKTTKQTLHYRIQRLLKEGVINGFITAIDPAKLGYSLYEVWIQLSDISLKDRKELHQHLMEHNNIRFVGICAGRYDLAISILAKNTPDFMDIFKRIARKFPGHFKEYMISTAYEFYRFSRPHFVEKDREAEELFRLSVGEPEDLDKADIKILSILADDSRAQILDIAKKARIAPNTVRSRIKSMEDMGVIKRYLISMDAKKAGFRNRNMLISLHNMSEEKEKELEQYCLQNRYISYMMKVVGKWDFYLSFDSYTEEHFQDFLIEFRSRFADIIRDFEYLSVMEELKFNYYPIGNK
jgi:DNA-binding Lrp family transcriptional regulator